MRTSEAGGQRSAWIMWFRSHGLGSSLLMLMGALLAMRCALLVTLPLTDTTEARYAEISRKMVETHDWITPQSEYGVPFWAKPPLSMWLSAAGMKLIGINECGARIFIFIASLLTLTLVYKLMSMQHSPGAALVSVVILLSSTVGSSAAHDSLE